MALDPNAPVVPQLNAAGQPVPVVAPIPFAVQTFTVFPWGRSDTPRLPRTRESFWRKY